MNVSEIQVPDPEVILDQIDLAWRVESNGSRIDLSATKAAIDPDSLHAQSGSESQSRQATAPLKDVAVLVREELPAVGQANPLHRFRRDTGGAGRMKALLCQFVCDLSVVEPLFP